MKNLAVVALCFLSTFASANEIEEVVVKARQIRVVLVKLVETHEQNPITGNWYYVEKKEEKEKDKA
jgi:hypothetical protein